MRYRFLKSWEFLYSIWKSWSPSLLFPCFGCSCKICIWFWYFLRKVFVNHLTSKTFHVVIINVSHLARRIHQHCLPTKPPLHFPFWQCQEDPTDAGIPELHAGPTRSLGVLKVVAAVIVKCLHDAWQWWMFDNEYELNMLDWLKHAPEFTVKIPPHFMFLDYQDLKSKFHVGFWWTVSLHTLATKQTQWQHP